MMPSDESRVAGSCWSGRGWRCDRAGIIPADRDSNWLLCKRNFVQRGGMNRQVGRNLLVHFRLYAQDFRKPRSQGLTPPGPRFAEAAAASAGAWIAVT